MTAHDEQAVMAALQQVNTALQSGDTARAIGMLESVLAEQPLHVESRVTLGRLYMQRGDHASALEHLQFAVDTKPADPALHNALGLCCYALQRYPQAEACYREVVRLAPAEIIGYANLAILYQDTGRREAAEDNSRKVIELAPALAAGHLLLATSLQLQGRYEAALAAFEQALQREPANIEALAGKANALSKLGRTAAAAAIIEDLVARGVSDHNVAHTYASLARKRGDAAVAADYIERVFESRPLNTSQRMHLHYTAGELYDHMDDYDAAFRHYRAGNELTRRDYRPQEFDLFLDATRKQYTAPQDMAHAGIASGGPQAVFIVGMPRSGTSLLESMLGEHPQISPAGELAMIPGVAARFTESTGEAFPACMSRVQQRELDAAAADCLTTLHGLADGARLVTDKLPHNFMYLGLIRQLFPNARIIHCRRDPLDTCLSNYFQYFSGALAYPYSLADIAHQYRFYRSMMQHWRDCGIDMLEMDYEQLVAQPRPMMERILGHLGLDMHEACLDFHGSERVTRTASVEQVRQPLYRRSIGRWRHYENHIRQLVDDLGVE